MSKPQFYTDRAQHFASLRNRVIVRSRLLGLARLLAFVGAFVLFFSLLSTSLTIAILLLVAFLAMFLVLVRYHLKLSVKKQYLSAMLAMNQAEAKVMEHDFSMMDGGERFIDPDHFNSYDLDIFGKGSLFQYLNRTTTRGGTNMLADWLTQPMLQAKFIKKRQHLVAELAPMVDWRQNFAVNGLLVEKESANFSEDSLTAELPPLRGVRSLPFVMALLVAFSIFALAFFIIAGNSGLLVIALVLQMVLWAFYGKAIKTTAVRMGKQLARLQQMLNMFTAIEQHNWQSAEAREKLEQMCQNGKPSFAVSRLQKMASAFDNRNNIIFGLVLNLLFCWDVWFTFRFWQWHNQYRQNLKVWLEALAFFDAANSLANLTYNHADFVFPQTASTGAIFEAEELGHPLINPAKRVNSSFAIKQFSEVGIVTGANMSGKSTFLRTIGVNMVLAMAGAPVCAQKMSFYPVRVFSNMRNTDSLFDDESYFFAELKRLRQLLDELEKGEQLLILLDEILKGTNSADKLAGSEKLLLKLLNFNAPVVVATHDLKLTDLENRSDGKVINYCFEIEILNDEMVFDYKLRKGTTKVMNASFLMKKMGIID